MIAIIDFGSQYTQLIARRVRELKVYCEIFPYTVSAEELKKRGISAVILSGGPGHIPERNAFPLDKDFFSGAFFILGICYGMQLTAQFFGGEVHPGIKREYGRALFRPDLNDPLFNGTGKESVVWMSHWDYVAKVPKGFTLVGSTDNCKAGAMRNAKGTIYGLQFHPEVVHTDDGTAILSNFLFLICHLTPSWNPASMLTMAQEQIRNRVGDGRIICAMSGGVDSSCLATIIHKVCGRNSLSVFVNNGVLRKDEERKIVRTFTPRINLRYMDASDLFLKKLKNVADPERKRKIIGKTFIEVFDREARTFGADYLAQGTLYPDVIESISPFGGPSVRIKSHHNVGGLPETLKLKLVEPFRFLFKDEVRRIAAELSIPNEIVNRQPFPGPGLAVRIIGSVSPQRLEVLRNADVIVMEEIKKAGFYDKVWQSFSILLPIKSVGIMGDKRTYDNVVAVRIVHSTDGMTADWVKLPHELLETISGRIVNEVKGVNRVVYDITNKPPATIEWE